MPNNSNDRLERDARESLVASDLSAKMKQWRDNPAPPDNDRGSSPFLKILLILLIAGGGAWFFWPQPKKAAIPDSQKQLPATPSVDETPVDGTQKSGAAPIAQNMPLTPNRYLALAQSHYAPPDFTAETRGDKPVESDMLSNARRALAAHRYSDALKILENAPPQFKTDVEYLSAHAMFGLKKYARAAEQFERLGGSVRYGEAAQWFEALSLLSDSEQNKTRAREILRTMANDEGHTFHEEAKSLLKAL